MLRHSRRDTAELEWELRLLTLLADHHQLRVPTPVPTFGGDLHAGRGWHMLTYIPGAVLEDGDEPRLLETLQRLHRATQGWSQRPGSRSASELLECERGGDVDLSVMPAGLVEPMRARSLVPRFLLIES